MAYKCKICGINDVNCKDGICDLCVISQDPYANNAGNFCSESDSSTGIDYNYNTNNDYNYSNINTQASTTIENASYQNGNNYISQNNDTYCQSKTYKTNRKILLNGGSQINNLDPYGNDISSVSNQSYSSTVNTYSSGQIPLNSSSSGQIPLNSHNVSQNKKSKKTQGPLTSGIIKNIKEDEHKRSILVKWMRALFKGIPFTLDNKITMFQIFPDYSGTSVNSQGNACDQVVVYGRIISGSVCDNNDVEIYGNRDTNNNIIARVIKNKASGTTITPQWSFSQNFVAIVTGIIVILMCSLIYSLGIDGIIWVAVFLLCITNFPLAVKIFGVFFAIVKSIYKKIIEFIWK